MRLGEKIQHLRGVEGQLRGLSRSLSMTEVVRLMREELGETLSLPYLSQIESGARPHMTSRTRYLIAKFFNVHPGYLVDDPDGYEERLGSLTESASGDLAEWLALRAEELRDDPEVYDALLRLASCPDPRSALVEFGRSLDAAEAAAPATSGSLA